jgi:hypothetical protein
MLGMSTEYILPSSETKANAEGIIIQFAIGSEEPLWYEFIRLWVFGLVMAHRPVRCSISLSHRNRQHYQTLARISASGQSHHSIKD